MAINIKKSHRGMFTAYKKRTGKTTEEALHSKNAHVRAMARFAKAARKWKHEEGGLLYDPILNEFYFGGELPIAQNGLEIKPYTFSDYAAGSTYNPSGIAKGTGSGAGLSAGLGMAGELGSGLINAFANPDEIKDNRVNINEGARAGKGALKGMAAGASIGSIIPGIGTLIGGGIGALAGGLSGFFGGRNEERRLQGDLNEQLEKTEFKSDVRSRLGRLQSNNSYMPVAKQGGFTIYKGETHNGPTGGILTDEQGNPSGLSNRPAIALTEKNEVARYNPDTKSTYIYSDSLGFAEPARDLVKKYKLDKDNSLYKYDNLLKTAVDKQFDNLMQAQEFAKETKTSSKDTIGLFGKGGSLNPAKAKEMLRDGTAHGKKLTSKQKAYFGWVAGGKKEDGGPLGRRNKDSLTVTNNLLIPQTDSNIDSILRERGLVSDTLRTITPQMRVNTLLANPDLGYSVTKGRPTANREGYNYWFKDTTNQINPRTPFVSNNMYNRTTPITQPILDRGGYIRKRKRPATYPFLPIPDAPIGAYTHSAVEKFGGTLPTYQDGGPGRLYYNKPSSLLWDALFNKPGLVGNLVTHEIPDSYGGIQKYTPSIAGRPGNIPYYLPGVPASVYTGQDLRGTSLEPQTYMGETLPEVVITGKKPGVSGTGINRVKPFTTPVNMNKINWSNYATFAKKLPNELAKGPVMPTTPEEQYNPTLSPLGHILSGAGALADYRALGKAKPIPASLGRMGAERISLARQRLINERNATGQRNINTVLGRNFGANAGVAMANTTAANTGVNRLLGQENMKSLETEETTNAQMRQQASAINAELAAQEGLFNTQQLNAWRMARAKANPAANLSKVAASYFADNAAYGQGYDTLKMLAPNAEVYRPDDQGFLDWLIGQQPGVRFKSKT